MGQGPYDKIAAYILENQNKFYRLAFSYVKNQEDALDVVQNAVCRALEHSGCLRDEAAVKTWFYRILVNESLQFLRGRKREVLSGLETAEIPCLEPAYEPGDDVYSRINCLEEEVQCIIKLRFYEELSLREIAEVTGLNLNTVKAKLYRGLKALKVVMQEVEG